MTKRPKSDLGYMSRDQSAPIVAENKSNENYESEVRTHPGSFGKDTVDPAIQSNGSQHSTFDQVGEDKIVALSLEQLEASGIFNNLPATMRLIEHIAEGAGYASARQTASENVTELMLMSARASKLADSFRNDLDPLTPSNQSNCPET